MVQEFHRAAGTPDRDCPSYPGKDRVNLRKHLIQEEALEVIEALSKGTFEELAKELADLLVVTYGAAAEFGIPMDKIFEEVHRSNMSKIGGPVRADGKLLKPANYASPNLAPLLGK